MTSFTAIDAARLDGPARPAEPGVVPRTPSRGGAGERAGCWRSTGCRSRCHRCGLPRFPNRTTTAASCTGAIARGRSPARSRRTPAPRDSCCASRTGTRTRPRSTTGGSGSASGTPRRLPDYLGEGFRACWSLELDPSDALAICSLLGSLGCDTAAFEGWRAQEGPRAAERVAEELRERGLFGVPGYLVDGEYFLGRQHLPMIRWILGGRQGAGPI